MQRLLIVLLLSTPQILWSQSVFDSLMLVKSAKIYFDLAQHEWQDGSDTVINELANFYFDNPDIRIHLTAHTDSVGTDNANQSLSDRRANTVLNALVEAGVPDSLLVIEAFGESVPEADNTTEEGRQQNRRVTIDCYSNRSMTYLSGQIKDELTGEGIPAEIQLRGKDYEEFVQTTPDGYFKQAVPDNKTIKVDVLSKGYFLTSKIIKTNTTHLLDILMPPAAPGKAASIPNLLFVGDKAVLLPESEKVLPQVYAFMKLNPTFVIEIGGHINRPNQPRVARDSWHFELSQDRAKVVYDYLLANGIAAKRLSYKGYGNWEMPYPKAKSANEQQQNRRVEIRVVDELEE
ncbi:MAG: OmpA family protein [Saprospiraceae bacterium]